MITLRSTSPKPVLADLVKIRDVAKILSVSPTTVRNLLECGELEGAPINAPKKPPIQAKRKKKRKHLRIVRDSFLLFYKKRSGHDLDFVAPDADQK